MYNNQPYTQQPNMPPPQMPGKPCKYCKQMIDARASVCPFCRRKQGSGCGTVFLVVVGIFVAIGAFGSLVGYISKGGKTDSSPETNPVQSETEQETKAELDLTNSILVPSDILYEYGESYIGSSVVTVATVGDNSKDMLKFRTDNNDSMFFSFTCTFEDPAEIENIDKDIEVAFVGVVESKDKNFNSVVMSGCRVISIGADASSKKAEVESNRNEQQAFAEQAKADAEQAANEAAIADIEEYKASCSPVDYEDVARNPNNYKGQNIIASGKVVQVSDGWFDTVTMRVSDDGNNVWYVTYAYQEGESRILENDLITVYGVCDGVKTYTSVIGSSVTIPSVKAKVIEMR